MVSMILALLVLSKKIKKIFKMSRHYVFFLHYFGDLLGKY